MNDVAEKLLALVERRRVLLDEVARIEAAFALALANVEQPKLLQAAPKAAVPKTRKPPAGDALSKKSAELQELRPHFDVLAPAERKIVEARVNGKMPEQIARDFGNTASSVSTVLYLAKKKLLAARESRPSGEKPTAPPASDDEEPPAACVIAPVARAPRQKRERREPKAPRTGEPARSKDANFAVFTQEMRQHTVLDREGELELFLRWKQTGDRRLADQLVAANLRLVLMIAKQYDRKRRHDTLDLVQEGSIGLFHALSKFDPERGIRFTSYASYWIRAYMLKFVLANHHLVKIGTTQEQRKLFFNLRKTRAELEKSGEPITVEQLAEALEVNVEAVIEMETRMAAAATSIDGPPDDSVENPSRRYEFPATDEWRPDVMIEARDSHDFAHEKMSAFSKTLAGRDRRLFDKRLIAEDPVTLVELADEFGVTRECVRQIEERLKEKLRRFVQREGQRSASAASRASTAGPE